MRTHWKHGRILAFLLVLCMMLSILPIAAFAEGTTTTPPSTEEPKAPTTGDPTPPATDEPAETEAAKVIAAPLGTETEPGATGDNATKGSYSATLGADGKSISVSVSGLKRHSTTDEKQTAKGFYVGVGILQPETIDETNGLTYIAGWGAAPATSGEWAKEGVKDNTVTTDDGIYDTFYFDITNAYTEKEGKAQGLDEEGNIIGYVGVKNGEDDAGTIYPITFEVDYADPTVEIVYAHEASDADTATGKLKEELGLGAFDPESNNHSDRDTLCIAIDNIAPGTKYAMTLEVPGVTGPVNCGNYGQDEIHGYILHEMTSTKGAGVWRVTLNPSDGIVAKKTGAWLWSGSTEPTGDDSEGLFRIQSGDYTAKLSTMETTGKDTTYNEVATGKISLGSVTFKTTEKAEPTYYVDGAKVEQIDVPVKEGSVAKGWAKKDSSEVLKESEMITVVGGQDAVYEPVYTEIKATIHTVGFESVGSVANDAATTLKGTLGDGCLNNGVAVTDSDTNTLYFGVKDLKPDTTYITKLKTPSGYVTCADGNVAGAIDKDQTAKTHTAFVGRVTIGPAETSTLPGGAWCYTGDEKPTAAAGVYRPERGTYTIELYEGEGAEQKLVASKSIVLASVQFKDGTETKDEIFFVNGTTKTVALPETPTKSGYAFNGWKNGSDVVRSGSVEVTKNTTYTAQWLDTSKPIAASGFAWGFRDARNNIVADVKAATGSVSYTNTDAIDQTAWVVVKNTSGSEKTYWADIGGLTMGEPLTLADGKAAIFYASYMDCNHNPTNKAVPTAGVVINIYNTDPTADGAEPVETVTVPTGTKPVLKPVVVLGYDREQDADMIGISFGETNYLLGRYYLTLSLGSEQIADGNTDSSTLNDDEGKWYVDGWAETESEKFAPGQYTIRVYPRKNTEWASEGAGSDTPLYTASAPVYQVKSGEEAYLALAGDIIDLAIEEAGLEVPTGKILGGWTANGKDITLDASNRYVVDAKDANNYVIELAPKWIDNAAVLRPANVVDKAHPETAPFAKAPTAELQSGNKVVITATGLQQHQNAQDRMGYWIGFALVAPKGATQVKYVFDKPADVTDAAWEVKEKGALETNVFGTKSGVAFFANLDEETPKTVAKVEWFKGDDSMGPATTYTMDLSGVTLAPKQITDVTATAGLGSLTFRYENGTAYLSGALDPSAANPEITLTATFSNYTPTTATANVTITVSDTTFSAPKSVSFKGVTVPVNTDGLFVKTESEAVSKVAAPDVPAPNTNGMEPEVKAAVDTIHTEITDKAAAIQIDLGAVADKEANNETVGNNLPATAANAIEHVTNVPATDTLPGDATEALTSIVTVVNNAKDNPETDTSDVKLVVQVYMEVAVTTAEVDTENANKVTSLTLSITPKKQTLLTTVQPASTDKLVPYDGENHTEANAVLVSNDPITISTPTDVQLPLPANFAEDSDTLVIEHKKGSNTYYYTGDVETDADTGELVLTFTSLHGFSDFTLYAAGNDPRAAVIDGEGYTTVAAAIAAVKDGQTIEILKPVETPVKVNKTVYFTVTGAACEFEPASDSVKMTVNGRTYTFEVESSGDSGNRGGGGAVVVEEKKFIDVNEGDYFYDAVYWAVEKGIVAGTSETTFSPYRQASRADIVTFLWRAAGSPKADADCPFTDVASGTYYYDAVLWAVANGITKGTSETTFAPNKSVSRAEAVTFLHRFAGKPGAGDGAFEDVLPDVYYAAAVNWAAETKVTVGTSANAFSPDNTCDRAQIVCFLQRYMGK